MAEMFLPVEISTQILARLPVRFVLRFRSVSKAWRDMIDNQVSGVLHLNRDIASGKKGPTSFFLRPSHYQDDLTMYLVEQEEEDDIHMFKASKISLSLPQTITIERVHFVAPARGLFAVCYYGPSGIERKNIFYYFICNPFTGQFSNLPVILSQEYNQGVICGGFGYNSSTGEFKVVRIFSSWITNETEVLVFTLGSKSWKKLENFPQEERPAGDSVSVDTFLHWFSKDHGFLLTFDLVSETFGSIQLPESRSSPNPGFLYNLNGCLSIADYWQLDDWIELWVMKDYGVMESWTKHLISRGSFENGDYVAGFQPVSFLNNTEILLLCDAKTLVVHNIESGIRTPLHICGLPGSPYFEAYPYCGNLLSLQPAD